MDNSNAENILQSSVIGVDCSSILWNREKDSSEERSPKFCRATRSFQPKRVSELPPLESESDSDDDNNLNCAILNDSFLLTPSKTIEEVSSSSANAQKSVTTTEPTKGKENVTERPARKKLDDVLAKQTGDQPQQESAPKAPLKRVPLVDRSQLEKQFSIFNTHDSTKSSKMQDSGISIASSTIFSIPENVADIETKQQPSVEKVIEGESTPMVCENHPKIQSPPKECPEISDRNRHLFVTPGDKLSLNHARGTTGRMLTSTANRKSRNTLENEFKSQKILFATPLSTGLARPPVSANDSLSLSLVDTPIKSKDRPLSPIKEQIRPSKRSTEDLFPSTPAPEKRLSPEPRDVPPKSNEIAGSSKESLPTVMPESKPSHIVTINGKDYQIMKKLGSGGSSSVFLAKQSKTGLECALKLVNLEGDASLVEGYLNETKLLAKLQGNENVVALYDYYHIPDSNQLFLVMEKGDSDLHKILQNYRKDIPLFSLMQIWYQMIQCVHYIHEHGVIHLDLKPANFLMVKGRLKLIDFGIASNIAYDSTSIMKFSQAGTFNYISPEALIDTSTESSPISAQPKIRMSKKSDIWSLGCILYLLLYKQTPFAHIKNIHTKVNIITNPNTVIEYPSLPSYYPPMLLEMLQKCLRYDPKSRASTAELLEYPFDMVIPLSALAK
ncbi:dual specificity protein kinase Ttk [Uranotaenia lowii]|uniref:dual specificity protein kinase Ttk n=1 Tax=Uranotaenia lowii TaxID=190385 RepID=UPI0024790A63|nr:dual specificity protein kinase Ttk [Uranotaenia lowii]